MKKGKKKVKETTLKKKLWVFFSKYIRLKYADEEGRVSCVTCQRTYHWKEVHAGHYIAKSRGLAVYFAEKNVHPQCVYCNYHMRGNLDKYALFLIRKYGQGILEELNGLLKEIRQIKAAEYLELIETYKAKVKELEADKGGFVFGSRE